METGKVEYAPDYKSGKQRPGRYPDTSQVFRRMEIRAEQQRLKDAVVEAAKEERRLERLSEEGNNTLIRTDALIQIYGATIAKRSAVDALLAFEAEHGIGE